MFAFAMDMYDETAVYVRDLTVEFSGSVILDNINLEIKKGEFWGIIGPNGGGKTTLIKTIIGIVKPKKGYVRLFGLDPREAVKRKLVGYLPQHVSSFFPFTAVEVVELAAGSRKRAKELLDLVGMSAKMNISFSTLSGGERQRVLIALTLSNDPMLLLLDEPSTGIDIVAQDNFYSLLKDIKNEKNTTIVMVSHDIGVVVNFVDKVACLNKSMKISDDPKSLTECRLIESMYGSKIDIFIHHPGCSGCHIYRKS